MSEARRIIRHLEPFHQAVLGFLPIRIISPEVLPALPDNTLARLEGLELIGPSPEGLFDVALMAHLLEIFAGSKPDLMVIGTADEREETRVGHFRLDQYLVQIDDLHLLDHPLELPDSGCPFEVGRVLSHQGFDISLEVLCSGRSAILPFGLRIEGEVDPFIGLPPVSGP